MSEAEQIRGTLTSFFNSSDKALYETEAYEAIPFMVKWKCGKCGVALNHDFDSAAVCYCLNHHLNRRPETMRWEGQR